MIVAFLIGVEVGMLLVIRAFWGTANESERRAFWYGFGHPFGRWPWEPK